MEYTVRWTIEMEAESHEEAAVLAREILLDPESEATHFEVIQSKELRSRKWVDVNVKKRTNGK